MSHYHPHRHHAEIISDGQNWHIKRVSGKGRVAVNGIDVGEGGSVVLQHHARILIGHGHLYCVSLPVLRDQAAAMGYKWSYPTYEQAQVREREGGREGGKEESRID